MRACDLMKTDLVALNAEASVRELLDKLHQHRLPSVPVLDGDGRPCGSVSQSDVLRALDREMPLAELQRIPQDDVTARRLAAAHAARSVRVYGEGDPTLSDRRVLRLLARPVCDVMSRQVVSVDAETEKDELTDLLVRSGAHRILVTRDGVAVGYLTASEVLRTAINATPLALANSF